MLFQPHLCRMILTGRKTQTRRRVQPGKAGAAPRCFYRAGHSYRLERPMKLNEANELQAAIIEGHRRGRPPKKEIGRIRVTDIAQGPLGDLSFDDARAEGFKTTTAFKAYWVRLHDGSWIKRQEESIDPDDGALVVDRHLTDEDLAARFTDRWADLAVWTISFELEATTLYLAERCERVGSDYVTAERDENGRQVAMTTQVDVENWSEPRQQGIPGWNHGELLSVAEEAVHPELIDGWPDDPASTHSQIKKRIHGSGHTTQADERAISDRVARHQMRLSQAKDIATRNGVDVRPQIREFRDAMQAQRSLDHLDQLLNTLERAANTKPEARYAA